MAQPPLPGIVSFTKTWHCEQYPFISPGRPELPAAGLNVVVTGGSAGIGKAIAVAFAQTHAKSVAIVGRRLDRLQSTAEAIKSANPSIQVIIETGDVTKRESIEAAMKNIAEKVGKIDIFASNAGMLPTEHAVYGYDEADIRYAFDAIVMGAFNSFQAIRPLAAHNAKVFNTGSAIGHWQPQPEVPGVFAYAAAKAAAVKIFDYFASENPDLHVVSFQPGIIATEINPKITEGFDKGTIMKR